MDELENELLNRKVEINLKFLNTPELYLLDPEYDHCIVGVSINGAVIYDFADAVYVYYQLHKDELSIFDDDVAEFFSYCENKLESSIDGLTDIELQGKQKPVLITLNQYTEPCIF